MIFVCLLLLVYGVQISHTVNLSVLASVQTVYTCHINKILWPSNIVQYITNANLYRKKVLLKLNAQKIV